ncbi:AMP-binding protein, partial [Mycolicibacterium confluentis]
MEFDELSLPITHPQLDIWLAGAAGHSGAEEWQLGLFAKIEGAVERYALEWSIGRVLQEAEPLRAAFVEANGQIFQKPLDHPDFTLQFYDLTDSQDSAEKAREIASSIQRTPMPLAGSLFRFALFQTRDDEYFLFGACHHIVLDGTGVALIGQRIASVYSAIVTGAAVPPTLFGTLADLVSLESEYEASREYLEDEAYWTGNIPVDGDQDLQRSPTVVDPNSHWPTEPVALDQTVMEMVEKCCEVWTFPRSSVITAACALLARGYDCRGSNVVLELPVTRRVRPESKTLPGMVAGVVPLVLEASPEASVSRFCEHVDQRMREALQHQRFPVQALERKLRPRGAGQPPQRLSINFLPASFTLDFGGVPATASLINVGVVGGFGLVFSDVGGEVLLSTMGQGHPLSDLTTAELVNRLNRVLVAMTADTSQLLSSLDLLDVRERRSLDVFGRRDVLAGSVSESSIPAVFAQQVLVSPNAIAVRCDGRSWTYQELDEASNRMAHLLISHGAGPGECVGLVLGRSAEAIVSILAVLKSGAAYLPIDPVVPDSRLEFMLADAAPVAVVSGAGSADRLTGCGVLVVDVSDPHIDHQSRTAPVGYPAPDDVAHIIYTSGTTGVPKGVAVTHGNVTR